MPALGQAVLEEALGAGRGLCGSGGYERAEGPSYGGLFHKGARVGQGEK